MNGPEGAPAPPATPATPATPAAPTAPPATGLPGALIVTPLDTTAATAAAPVPLDRAHYVTTAAVVALLFVISGLLGLKLSVINPSASAVWPPTGIAIAALLLFGRRMWPAVFVASFIVNQITAGTVATSFAIATGAALEAVVAAELTVRFAGGRGAFGSARTVFLYALLASVISTAIAATVGVTSLAIAGLAHWHDYWMIWTTWWLGDASGSLVVTPLILLWAANWRVKWSATQQIEATIVLVGILLAGQVAFAGLQPTDLAGYPMAFLCIPFLVWTAYRLGPREVATAMLILAGIAINGTLKGFGPFAGWPVNEGLQLLETFISATAVMTLAFASVVSERDRVEAQLRDLAITDPLTGLSNYRQLLIVLEAEIQRSSRTGRPFSVLLLDLDGLKKINDANGHLVGSRAIVRLAVALKRSTRVLDTTARYGGDEFAVVLPESGADAAKVVSGRIERNLEGDTEYPPVRASLGIAIFPDDGRRAEELISVADKGLYAEKRRRKAQTPPRPSAAIPAPRPSTAVPKRNTPPGT